MNSDCDHNIKSSSRYHHSEFCNKLNYAYTSRQCDEYFEYLEELRRIIFGQNYQNTMSSGAVLSTNSIHYHTTHGKTLVYRIEDASDYGIKLSGVPSRTETLITDTYYAEEHVLSRPETSEIIPPKLCHQFPTAIEERMNNCLHSSSETINSILTDRKGYFKSANMPFDDSVPQHYPFTHSIEKGQDYDFHDYEKDFKDAASLSDGVDESFANSEEFEKVLEETDSVFEELNDDTIEDSCTISDHKVQRIVGIVNRHAKLLASSERIWKQSEESFEEEDFVCRTPKMSFQETPFSYQTFLSGSDPEQFSNAGFQLPSLFTNLSHPSVTVDSHIERPVEYTTNSEEKTDVLCSPISMPILMDNSDVPETSENNLTLAEQSESETTGNSVLVNMIEDYVKMVMDASRELKLSREEETPQEIVSGFTSSSSANIRILNADRNKLDDADRKEIDTLDRHSGKPEIETYGSGIEKTFSYEGSGSNIIDCYDTDCGVVDNVATGKWENVSSKHALSMKDVEKPNESCSQQFEKVQFLPVAPRKSSVEKWESVTLRNELANSTDEEDAKSSSSSEITVDDANLTDMVNSVKDTRDKQPEGDSIDSKCLNCSNDNQDYVPLGLVTHENQVANSQIIISESPMKPEPKRQSYFFPLEFNRIADTDNDIFLNPETELPPDTSRNEPVAEDVFVNAVRLCEEIENSCSDENLASSGEKIADDKPIDLAMEIANSNVFEKANSDVLEKSPKLHSFNVVDEKTKEQEELIGQQIDLEQESSNHDEERERGNGMVPAHELEMSLMKGYSEEKEQKHDDKMENVIEEMLTSDICSTPESLPRMSDSSYQQDNGSPSAKTISLIDKVETEGTRWLISDNLIEKETFDTAVDVPILQNMNKSVVETQQEEPEDMTEIVGNVLDLMITELEEQENREHLHESGSDYPELFAYNEEDGNNISALGVIRNMLENVIIEVDDQFSSQMQTVQNLISNADILDVLSMLLDAVSSLQESSTELAVNVSKITNSGDNLSTATGAPKTEQILQHENEFNDVIVVEEFENPEINLTGDVITVMMELLDKICLELEGANHKWKQDDAPATDVNFGNEYVPELDEEIFDVVRNMLDNMREEEFEAHEDQYEEQLEEDEHEYIPPISPVSENIFRSQSDVRDFLKNLSTATDAPKTEQTLQHEKEFNDVIEVEVGGTEIPEIRLTEDVIDVMVEILDRVCLELEDANHEWKQDDTSAIYVNVGNEFVPEFDEEILDVVRNILDFLPEEDFGVHEAEYEEQLEEDEYKTIPRIFSVTENIFPSQSEVRDSLENLLNLLCSGPWMDQVVLVDKIELAESLLSDFPNNDVKSSFDEEDVKNVVKAPLIHANGIVDDKVGDVDTNECTIPDFAIDVMSEVNNILEEMLRIACSEFDNIETTEETVSVEKFAADDVLLDDLRFAHLPENSTHILSMESKGDLPTSVNFETFDDSGFLEISIAQVTSEDSSEVRNDQYGFPILEKLFDYIFSSSENQNQISVTPMFFEETIAIAPSYDDEENLNFVQTADTNPLQNFEREDFSFDDTNRSEENVLRRLLLLNTATTTYLRDEVDYFFQLDDLPPIPEEEEGETEEMEELVDAIVTSIKTEEMQDSHGTDGTTEEFDKDEHFVNELNITEQSFVKEDLVSDSGHEKRKCVTLTSSGILCESENGCHTLKNMETKLVDGSQNLDLVVLYNTFADELIQTEISKAILEAVRSVSNVNQLTTDQSIAESSVFLTPESTIVRDTIGNSSIPDADMNLEQRDLHIFVNSEPVEHKYFDPQDPNFNKNVCLAEEQKEVDLPAISYLESEQDVETFENEDVYQYPDSDSSDETVIEWPLANDDMVSEDVGKKSSIEKVPVLNSIKSIDDNQNYEEPSSTDFNSENFPIPHNFLTSNCITAESEFPTTSSNTLKSTKHEIDVYDSIAQDLQPLSSDISVHSRTLMNEISSVRNRDDIEGSKMFSIKHLNEAETSQQPEESTPTLASDIDCSEQITDTSNVNLLAYAESGMNADACNIVPTNSSLKLPPETSSTESSLNSLEQPSTSLVMKEVSHFLSTACVAALVFISPSESSSPSFNPDIIEEASKYFEPRNEEDGN